MRALLVHCNIFLCMRSDKKTALILWPLKPNEGMNTVSTVKWLSPSLDPCICSFPTLDGCLCYMCLVSAPVQPSSRCFCWALEMQGWAKDFLFLLIMLWDTQVMKTHSYTDIAPDLMFWCLNLPALHFFYEVTNNGLNILSSEKSGTDAHSPGWKCIWVGLKINSMQCQF